MSLETIFTFIAASILLSLVPGPDNVFVLTQSALSGRLAGILVSLGLCTGLIVQTAAVALGLAVIFQTSLIAFTVLKLTGAAYLLYLAWKIIHAAPIEIGTNSSRKIKKKNLYLRGFIMNITNPKVAIFFLAFLPQFVNPAKGFVSLQIAVLGCLFILSTIVVFGSVSILAGSISSLLTRSAKTQKIMNWIAGSIFVVLALTLATAEV